MKRRPCHKRRYFLNGQLPCTSLFFSLQINESIALFLLKAALNAGPAKDSFSYKPGTSCPTPCLVPLCNDHLRPFFLKVRFSVGRKMIFPKLVVEEHSEVFYPPKGLFESRDQWGPFSFFLF